MKKLLAILAALPLLAASAWAAPAERYLHVKVDDAAGAQKISVNIPLSLAAKVIPAIDNGRLHDGRVRIGRFESDGVDIRQILDALQTAPDGEFVTVDQPKQHVRVAKRNGQLIVRVTDRKHEDQNVSVTLPWTVAEALASSTDKHELNLEAAIQALEKASDTTLVTVTGSRQTVRVWIDSQSAPAPSGDYQ
ncbi:MAG TPA: hypothetical protein VGS20_07475 [Candidatus Acidoferrales bacterium]|nr:hypothetical protein [Candidatus Acidoferrales bacterium]